MSVNLPTGNLPAGDLARCVTHEADDGWPSIIEIVAYWGEGRKGRRRSISISANEFFGRGGYGAPMSGDRLLMMINELRKRGPQR